MNQQQRQLGGDDPCVRFIANVPSRCGDVAGCEQSASTCSSIRTPPQPYSSLQLCMQ